MLFLFHLSFPMSHLGMFTGADNMKTTLTPLLSGIVLLEKGQWENPGLFPVVAKEEGSRAGIHRDGRTGGYEQREYELYKLNGSWVNAYDCQEISENRCDLTHDLASNSDYSIRIKTNCDGKKSWTQLPATFNRRDTVLLAPKMTVNVEGDPIQVGFSTTLSDMTINLKVWNEGDEQNALIHVIRAYPYHFSIAAHRGEEKMCFRAEAIVEAINKICSIDTQCVIIPEQTSDFVKPMIVSIAVVVAVAVVFILGWSATYFGPQIKQICHREPIPRVLVSVHLQFFNYYYLLWYYFHM
ncbi:Interleukin-20 receptor subunit beta [Anabarilius grahami]|uniref:Interleukin-20 receptor subunit beta n=1 Tax=Anabarilius grahami TaxID=495550 RepID=A0A3N0YRG4_ANAGA|nr:Interleukin-20 receptor subunit beta [Anabarilius grahami]